ncbi:hypothetical protein ABZW10_04155 [Kitasatospora sp. NPDC004723]|uniref:hypothetical protein n=1 Tax=Kitasatospora sp. NPDC004723 TaxID=3154288 RepID=UPI0033A41422
MTIAKSRFVAGLALAAVVLLSLAGPAAATGSGAGAATGTHGRAGSTDAYGGQNRQMDLSAATLVRQCQSIGRAQVQSLITLVNVGLPDAPAQPAQPCADGESAQSQTQEEIVVSGDH